MYLLWEKYRDGMDREISDGVPPLHTADWDECLPYPLPLQRRLEKRESSFPTYTADWRMQLVRSGMVSSFAIPIAGYATITYRTERARVNTADPFHLPAFASVKLFTYQNPGLYRIMQCV